MSAALVRAGYGVKQAPRFRFEDDLASGVLVAILPLNPPTGTPRSVLYPSRRHLNSSSRTELGENLLGFR